MREIGILLDEDPDFVQNLLRITQVQTGEGDGNRCHLLAAFRSGEFVDPPLIQVGNVIRTAAMSDRLFKVTLFKLTKWLKAVRYSGSLSATCVVTDKGFVSVSALRSRVPSYLVDVLLNPPEVLRKGVEIGLGPEYAISIRPLKSAAAMKFLETLNLISRR